MRNHLRRGVRYGNQSSDHSNDGMSTDRQDTIRNEDKVMDFINNYLRHDGVFLLRLIAHNTNGITTTEITRELWDRWYDRQQQQQYGDGTELKSIEAHDHETVNEVVDHPASD